MGMTRTTQTEKDESYRIPDAAVFERGDEVDFRYVTDDGPRSGTGVVVKAPKNKVVVLLLGARIDRTALRVFTTGAYASSGRVFRNNRAGNGRKKRVGADGVLRRTGHRLDVRYEQGTGYVYDDGVGGDA